MVANPVVSTSIDAVAIITGASSGAGRELARALARRGAAVVVVYLRERCEADAVVDEILAANGTALTVRADITDELDVERLFDETAAAFGAVDLVVHAAVPGGAVIDEQAARRLSPGGAIVIASSVPELAAFLDDWQRGARA